MFYKTKINLNLACICSFCSPFVLCFRECPATSVGEMRKLGDILPHKSHTFFTLWFLHPVQMV